jgi:hypothetical protein
MEAATAGVPLRAVVDAYLTATWRAGCCASHRKRSTNGLLAQSDSQGLDAYVRSHTSGCSAAWTIAPRRTREQLVSTVTDWPVGYVVVHGDRLAEPARAAVLAFLDGQTDVLCRLPGQGPLYVYRARWHPSGCQVR